MRHRLLYIGFSLLMIAIGLSACAKDGGSDGGKTGKGDKKKGQPVPVLTAKARATDMPLEMRAVGRVEAAQSSPVRSQVGGILTEIRFREGDFVQAGQVLFVIDQTPLKATLKQLRANLARDEAQRQNAEAQLKNSSSMANRYEQLVQKDFVTREQYEQRMTNLAAAQAALDASQATTEATKAAVESAEIQLGYTEIRSPLAGQTGSLLVKQGDLVKANDSTALVTVNQIEPILVRFSANEEKLAEIQKSRAQEAMPVRVTPPGGGMIQEGRLVFVDNAVDPATATIALKAELPNRDHALWPGQFVDTTMTLRTLESALVVPTSAVLTGQNGPYVYVVDAEGAVAVRPVKPDISVGEETVIADGLKLDETVVTDGQLRLTPGAKVIVKEGLEAESAGQKPSPEAAAGPDTPSGKTGKPAPSEKTP